MPTTLIDALAVELSLDPRQFEQGLKSVVEKVKVTRDDYERHAKSFEAAAASLFRAITPLVAAITSIGTAIAAINWSQHAAAATTEFTNLADILGMNIEKLSAWKQAAEAAGKGGGDALVQAMARQQQTMLTMLPGGTGLKDPEFLRALQRYGMANVSQYLDANGNLDMDKFERDLTSASERMDKTPAERAQWMARLYITNPANLSLLKNRADLDATLKHQREVVGVLNKENTDAMKQLHADFTNLATAASNLATQVVTNLADPLHEGLTGLTEILNKLKDWKPPSWLKWAFPSLVAAKDYQESKEGFFEYWFKPHWPASPGARTESPGGYSGFIEPFGGEMGIPAPSSRPSVPSVPLVPAPPSVPTVPLPPPPGGVETQGGAIMVPPRTGIRPSLPALPGPSGALDLPQYAMDLGRSEMTARSGNTVSNSSNITIGAMSFNSRATDTELEHAPAGSERTLSVGQYAVLANTSLI